VREKEGGEDVFGHDGNVSDNDGGMLRGFYR
jgi:hypothetical protein